MQHADRPREATPGTLDLAGVGELAFLRDPSGIAIGAMRYDDAP